MRQFWVAATTSMLLVFAAMNPHADTAETSMCGPLAICSAVLSEKGDGFEYALVTATVTGMLTGGDGLLQYAHIK